MRLLGVTQVNVEQPLAELVCRSAVDLLKSHGANLEFVVNVFQGSVDRLPCAAHKRITTWKRAGSKALLWKELLAPSLTQHFDVIWLFDSDLDFGIESFHLHHVLGVMGATNAPLLQPTVIPAAPGGRGTDIGALRPKADSFSGACVVHTTSVVEVQSPFFRVDAWNRFYADVLSRVPDELLRECDYVDAVMCPHAELVMRGSCLVTQGAHLVHLDAVTKRLKAEQQQRRGSTSYQAHRRCARTLYFLWHTFPASRGLPPGRWSVETAPPDDDGDPNSNRSVPWFLRAAPEWFRRNIWRPDNQTWYQTGELGSWYMNREHKSECVDWRERYRENVGVETGRL